MFNVEKFIEATSDESLTKRLQGIRAFKRAPLALQKLMRNLALMERNTSFPKTLEVFVCNFEVALLIFERCIPFEFSQKDMNQGKKMDFHPITGDPFSSLKLEGEG